MDYDESLYEGVYGAIDERYRGMESVQMNIRYARSINKGEGYKYNIGSPEKQRQQRNKNLEYTPGVHTRSFRGTASAVNDALEDFHEAMNKKYENYNVSNVNSVPVAGNKINMYLTFSVGNKRKIKPR